jgi:hypothetical protein
MGLFDNASEIECFKQDLVPGAVLLRGFALPQVTALLTALYGVIEPGPFRHMVTQGGAPYVGRHDQLRLAGLDFRQDGLPL